jgi:hypothetical protein
VLNPGNVYGDSSLISFLGLPVPLRCETIHTGERLCYFNQGIIKQTITESRENELVAFTIHESFHLRDWLSLEKARHTLTPEGSATRLTRTDVIQSTLQPRWYWSHFEAACVGLEQAYVMRSMKMSLESGDHLGEGH